MSKQAKGRLARRRKCAESPCFAAPCALQKEQLAKLEALRKEVAELEAQLAASGIDTSKKP